MRSDMKEEYRDKIKRNQLNFDSTVPGLNRNVAYSINVNLPPPSGATKNRLQPGRFQSSSITMRFMKED